MRRTTGGIGPPPDGIEERRALAAPGAGTVPHFFAGPGPMDVVVLPEPVRVRLRGGGSATAGYEIPWRLGAVRGVPKREALRRLYDVLLDPDGWVRAGVRWRRVTDPLEARLVVSVVPMGATRCGRGAAGCYSWEDGETPLAECGVELIGRDGPWRMIVGMEVCGHALRMDDGYLRPHLPYRGAMGDWEAAAAFGFRPSEAEIDAARAWLAGAGPPAVTVHGH